MSERMASYDILMVTDCRFPGGTSSSVVEEIQAQHRAGYRTGLLHLPSTVLTYPRPFNPKIRSVINRGEVELVLGIDRIETRLLLARHPSVFTSPPTGLPEVVADEVVLAANQAPMDARGERPYYDVHHVDSQLQKMFGKPALWAPIGPRVRDSLLDVAQDVRLWERDWENVIDVDAWRVERTGFVGDKPVIGRHSRGHWSKWPDDRDHLLAAYPDDPDYIVSVLGGTATPRRMLGGRLPPNWIDHPFNSIPAQEYLRGIDFLVYYHHPGLIEAFGRVVLEGIAAGAVAIVPPYLERLFGDVCLYGEPADVRGHIDAIFGNWPAFEERSARGVALAEQRFSYATHIDRVEALIGPARPVSGSTEDPSTETAEVRASAPRRPAPLLVDLRTPVEASKTPLSELASGLSNSGRPGVVALPVEAAELAPAGWVAESFPTALRGLSPPDRTSYLQLRVEGMRRDHRPSTIVLIDDGGNTAASTAASAEADGLEVLVIEPGISRQLADDDRPNADTIRAALPVGWVLQARPARSPGPATSGRDAVPRTPRHLAKWMYWRLDRQLRRARRMVVNRLRRSKRFARPAVRIARDAQRRLLGRAAGSTGMSLVALPSAPFRLPTRDWLTHPDPTSLPLVLVVAPSPADSPEVVVRRLVELQQETSGFRLALLAPTTWRDAAARYDVTLETLIAEGDWRSLHGSGWDRYLERRIREVRAMLSATSVLPIDPDDLEVTLAALEASGSTPTNG